MPILSHDRSETAAEVAPSSFANWITGRRIRAHAIMLALCLWGVCAVDFATPGLFDRAGNIKFQDFLQFYISARLIREHRSSALFSQQVADDELHAIVGQPTATRLPTVYGPQVGLLFVPLAQLSFAAAARVWVGLSMLTYFVCMYAVWRACSALRNHPRSSIICAIAFPPLFHFFVRGQISVLLLAFLTAAFLAFRAGRPLLAGIALGCLVLKPQFLIAIPVILLLSRAWTPLAGLLLSAAAQLAAARLYFGPGVMHSYLDMLRHASRWINLAELPLAPIQMHSMRAFWSLLVPSQTAVLVLFALGSIVILWICASIWKSQAPLAIRFSALLLAIVLMSPHIFIYDLLVLAPMFLLLVNWILENRQHATTQILRLLLYLAFVVPMLGPLSRWTHLQLSVLIFATILWILFCIATRRPQLASSESL